jgi:hypothetical protein
MSYCITYGGPGGACTDITYAFGGMKYPCGGCTTCTDAYYAAYTACQDAVGGCKALSSCCGVIASAYQSSCRTTVSNYEGEPYGDVTCKATLKSYESSGLCP